MSAVAIAAPPVNRETFGIPADEDPWSQVPDPSNPINTARAYFEHFLLDNGGLRKENDGEPRRYANVFFDFRRGRSKFYRDVLGIDNGKVSTLASQDWQMVKSTEYGKKFWKQVADETARLYDTRFPGQRQRQPIFPTVIGNRPMPLAMGAVPSVLAPPLPPSPPRTGRPRPAPITIRRRSSTQALVQPSPSRPRTASTASSSAPLPSPARPSPRYSPYAMSASASYPQARYSPPSMSMASSLPTHYEGMSQPSHIYYATSSSVTPITPVAPPPHVLPIPAPHVHPAPPQVSSSSSLSVDTSYPPRSLSMDTSSLQPPNMQLQRHSLDMGVFAYEGTSTGSTPTTSGAPSWPPQHTAPPAASPTSTYFPVPPPPHTQPESHTPSYTDGYSAQPAPYSYGPSRTYSPNPACAPVTHIDPTLFAGAGPRWYDHSQGVSPRNSSTPILPSGEYEGYHAWTPEMQL